MFNNLKSILNELSLDGTKKHNVLARMSKNSKFKNRSMSMVTEKKDTNLNNIISYLRYNGKLHKDSFDLILAGYLKDNRYAIRVIADVATFDYGSASRLCRAISRSLKVDYSSLMRDVLEDRKRRYYVKKDGNRYIYKRYSSLFNGIGDFSGDGSIYEMFNREERRILSSGGDNLDLLLSVLFSNRLRLSVLELVAVMVHLGLTYNKSFYIKRSRLAAITDRSIDSIDRYKKVLEVLGLLEVSRKKKSGRMNYVNKYTVSKSLLSKKSLEKISLILHRFSSRFHNMIRRDILTKSCSGSISAAQYINEKHLYENNIFLDQILSKNEQVLTQNNNTNTTIDQKGDENSKIASNNAHLESNHKNHLAFFDQFKNIFVGDE